MYSAEIELIKGKILPGSTITVTTCGLPLQPVSHIYMICNLSYQTFAYYLRSYISVQTVYCNKLT